MQLTNGQPSESITALFLVFLPWKTWALVIPGPKTSFHTIRRLRTVAFKRFFLIIWITIYIIIKLYIPY